MALVSASADRTDNVPSQRETRFLETKIMKKIIVHLGHGKTGTTAVQSYLHAAALDPTCPFLYPKTCRMLNPPAHHELFKAGFFPAAHWKQGQDKQMCDALYREIVTSEKSIAIISSETGLATIGRAPESNSHQIQFFGKLSEMFDVRVVYYVRNQLEQVESAFYTHARTLGLPVSEENFDNYLVSAIEQFDFWKNMESYWVGLVGKENLLSRTYHRSNLLDGDIVQDFLSLINLYPQQWKKFQPIETSQNETPQYDSPRQRGRLMTEKRNALIRDKFLESNSRYAAKYLGKNSAKYLLAGFA